MEQINKQAWDILTTDEKTAITLSLGYGKSTWEAGEVLKKAHFKYLEIQKRSVKFLEIFTLHFQKYGGLFPEELNLPPNFREYLSHVIQGRKNISKAINLMDDPSYLIASKRNKLITREMVKLSGSNKEASLDMYGLIMDFDRWNNFRILPLEIQEPSAFKRRNKARHIKHLNTITNLPQFSVLKIMEIYNYTGKYSKVYLPLISAYIDNTYKIIPVKDNRADIVDLTKAGLFLFTDIDMANRFAIIVSTYVYNSRDCKKGQKFWPEFREIISKALNYRQLENIHRSRTHLENTLFRKPNKGRVK